MDNLILNNKKEEFLFSNIYIYIILSKIKINNIIHKNNSLVKYINILKYSV